MCLSSCRQDSLQCHVKKKCESLSQQHIGATAHANADANCANNRFTDPLCVCLSSCFPRWSNIFSLSCFFHLKWVDGSRWGGGARKTKVKCHLVPDNREITSLNDKELTKELASNLFMRPGTYSGWVGRVGDRGPLWGPQQPFWPSHVGGAASQMSNSAMSQFNLHTTIAHRHNTAATQCNTRQVKVKHFRFTFSRGKKPERRRNQPRHGGVQCRWRWWAWPLTREMVSGMLKSFPPCSRKPHGAGPFRVTVYELVFASMWEQSSVATQVWRVLLLPGPGVVWCGLVRSGPHPAACTSSHLSGQRLLLGEPAGFGSAPAPSSQDKQPVVEEVGGGGGGGGGRGGQDPVWNLWDTNTAARMQTGRRGAGEVQLGAKGRNQNMCRKSKKKRAETLRRFLLEKLPEEGSFSCLQGC